MGSRTGYDELLTIERLEDADAGEQQQNLTNGAALTLEDRVIDGQPEPVGPTPLYSPSGEGGDRLGSIDQRRASVVRKRSSIFSMSGAKDAWDGIKAIYMSGGRAKKSTHGNELFTTEIYYSVYKAPNWVSPAIIPARGLLSLGPTSQREFDVIIDSARDAIDLGVTPKRIAAGSSGSYFIYNRTGKVVGVFKPKDEEPYGPLSPKWTKWLHRNLFPCFFGRSCLIPNNGYICEAAASVLDRQLQTYIVPFTDTVELASSAFYYRYFDRRKTVLPLKVGSFQLFLHGYDQANVFLRDNPLPSYLSRSGRHYSDEPDLEHVDDEDSYTTFTVGKSISAPKFKWTRRVLEEFRLELEKLVILDYIMRNTDRGLDNWMIKLEWDVEEIPDVKETDKPHVDHDHLANPFADPLDPPSPRSAPQEEPRPGQRKRLIPRLRIGAIDSGLAFPWKHPDEWRSYPFGWLFLPLALIGQPFSQQTREHFLPLLTSTKWWEESAIVFRQLFGRDTEFRERLFRRQWAVMKGQAFNVVETLKSKDQGPLELARRTRFMVWDDEMDVPVSVPVANVSHAIDTPLWATHSPAQERTAASDSVMSFPEIRTEDMDARPSPTTTNTSLTVPDLENAHAGVLGSPEALTRPLKSPVNIVKGRKRGGSLALEARYRELQSDKHDRSRSMWQQLVSSDLGGDTGSTEDNLNGVPALGPPIQFRDPTNPSGGPIDDLGYSYATGYNQASRKVIIERLQTVTSKPPVFTWC